MIGERTPVEADRAVPGHWEGDPLLGVNGTSAIGTLVERSTRFCLLMRLGRRRDAAAVAAPMADAMRTLPVQLCRALTDTRRTEPSCRIRLAAELDV
jgi:transposase, IS30 family